MTQISQFTEKRENHRYLAKEGSFAVITNGLRLGPIIDINETGLSFFYVPLDEKGSETDNVEIYFSDDDFHLQNISVELVSDYSIDENLPFKYVEKRRCSVKFGRLTPFQKIQLDYFIKNYTEI